MTQPAPRQTPEQVAAEKAALGPNAKTEPEKPEEHYYVAADGKTHINAFGEVKGSPEDKKRW
jgi:hypothetical protein